MSVAISKYPLGYKITHFKQARRLLLATSQAAGPLWEFRWSSTGNICLIKKILVTGVQTANATAEELRFSLKVARGFTAVDSANVASILRSGDNQKMNGDSQDSVLAGFVESNAATAASGGTYTADTDAIANGQYVTLGTASTTVDGADDIIIEFIPMVEDDQFLRLETNEGFLVTLDAAKGASQGFSLSLEVSWAECIKIP